MLGDDVRVARQPDRGEPALLGVGAVAVPLEHVGVDDRHARAGELVLGGRPDSSRGVAVAVERMAAMVVRVGSPSWLASSLAS